MYQFNVMAFDGCVFTFGMTPTIDGKGYGLVAYDGCIFAFSDAVYYGRLSRDAEQNDHLDGGHVGRHLLLAGGI